MDDYSSLLLLEQLSRMLCFRLGTIQYIFLSERSLSVVLRLSEDFIDFACCMNVHALLNLAINVFSSMATSLEKINTRCMEQAHVVLYSCTEMIF